MNRIIRALSLLLCSLLLTSISPGFAATDLEIVTLQHRPADELLPRLQAFVEPGGSLSGMNEKLFIRASPRNRAQLRELIAAMDVPMRRLLIRLASDDGRGGQADGGSISIGIGRNGGVGSQVYSTRTLRQGSGQQQIQTVDGGRATVFTGEAIVLPWRQWQATPTGYVETAGVVLREIRNGFIATPRLNGEQVTVEIEPVQEAWMNDGASRGIRLAATISGRLGEWLFLGGSDQAGESSGQYGVRSSSEARRLRLMVEELK